MKMTHIVTVCKLNNKIAGVDGRLCTERDCFVDVSDKAAHDDDTYSHSL